MKIKKHTGGRVLLIDNSGLIMSALHPSANLFCHSTKEDIIIISDNTQADDNQREIWINTAEISHTILNDAETAFSGNREDLFNLLLQSFFVEPTANGGSSSAGSSTINLLGLDEWSSSFAYNAAGDVAVITYKKSGETTRTLTFNYDAQGNLIGKTWS